MMELSAFVSAATQRSDENTDRQTPGRQRSSIESGDAGRSCPGSAVVAGRGFPLASGSVAPARRAGWPALVFKPLSAFRSLQKAAAGVATVAGFLSEGLSALAAQLLQTGTDRRKVIGSARSGHVSSSKLRRAPMRLERLWVGWSADELACLTLAHRRASKQGKSRNRIEKMIRLVDQTGRRCSAGSASATAADRVIAKNTSPLIFRLPHPGLRWNSAVARRARNLFRECYR
jgi:hypothetical protein